MSRKETLKAIAKAITEHPTRAEHMFTAIFMDESDEFIKEIFNTIEDGIFDQEIADELNRG